MEKILQALGPLGLPRPLAVVAVRRELGRLRAAETAPVPAFDVIIATVRTSLDRLAAGRIRPVINGTGVLLHTNLGRAPLSKAAIDAVVAVSANYNNLEYDLHLGERGSRAGYVEQGVALLCNAEAATVVNNCAAALILILKQATRGTRKEVVVSRGELIQIGGGFRIPEILEASGARLREVGTTNKTTLDDYAAAIGPETALVLKVHQSNFYQGGFIGFPAVAEIASLARKKKIPFAEDLGSGALASIAANGGVEHERTPAEAIRDGVDMVCFSGDKLLGGPQAGLIAGRARRIVALKREPFFRALRCDKLVLAALQATVGLYLDRAESEIPVLSMMRMNEQALVPRADAIVAALAGLPLNARVCGAGSKIGGGTLPRATLPSIALELRPTAHFDVPAFAAKLRGTHPPVIGYVANDCLHLDLRTVFPRQDEELVLAIRSLFP